jgi:O-antigen/teichoic acid export membrane protein
MNAFPAVAGQLDAVMAFQFLGPAGLAVYAFATAIPDRLGSLFKFFPVAALPKFAERTDEEIRRSIGPKLLKLGALAIAFAGVYALIVPVFFHIFFPTYLDAIPYSQLYALALVLIVANVASAALTAKARTKALYVANIATTVLGLFIQLIGIIYFGLMGLVLAKVASAFLSAIIFTLILLRAPRAPQSPPELASQ